MEEQHVPIPAGPFYAEFHGHRVEHLRLILSVLRRGRRAAIFLAGDSSLDNKYWLSEASRAPAVNGYERVLAPPEQKPDVAYWLNRELVALGHGARAFALNAAVEATALSDRSRGTLLAQDAFICDNLGRDDHLVVSIGGNDIALRPSVCTLANLLPLVHCTPPSMLRRGCARPPDVYSCCGDCGCQGLQGCVAGACCACPPWLGYLVDLFGNRIRQYVMRLLGAQRPKTVVVCMVYFPSTAAESDSGWADAALSFLAYDRRPQSLQRAIRTIFELAIRRICIEGTRVVPFAMFDVLDGTDAGDYVQRVEPSSAGGRKLARALVSELIHGKVSESVTLSPAAPLGAMMR